MKPRTRLLLFLPAAAGLAVVLLAGFHGLPGLGHYAGPYGFVLSDVAVSQRHATDVVAAINFDYRAFDTLGEEFILFAAVLATMLLLRAIRGEHKTFTVSAADDHRFGGASDALRASALGLVAAMIVFGGYIVAHGHITPGGGFQGGILLASGAFIVFLAGEYVAMQRVAPHRLAELGEAVGAAAYGLIGLGGLIFASVFFKNFLELGKPGELVSAGTIALANIAVGIEVAGAFLMIWSEFLDQAITVRAGGGG